jgi:hypothetical protein
LYVAQYIHRLVSAAAGNFADVGRCAKGLPASAVSLEKRSNVDGISLHFAGMRVQCGRLEITAEQAGGAVENKAETSRFRDLRDILSAFRVVILYHADIAFKRLVRIIAPARFAESRFIFCFFDDVCNTNRAMLVVDRPSRTDIRPGDTLPFPAAGKFQPKRIDG